MKKKTIAAVSGAHGFIGTHLTTALEAKGIDVYPLPREAFAYPPQLESMLAALQPTYIYHLGAYGNMSWQTDEAEIFNANLAGTFNLLQASKDIPYQALINVSSSSVMLAHQTFYSASKAGAEFLCHAFADEYDKPIVTVRPYSVYGPGEDERRFIPTVFRSCLSGEPMQLVPKAAHDWVYINDVVRGIIHAADTAAVLNGHELFLGTGVGEPNVRVVAMIEEITGKQANVTKSDSMRSFDSDEWVCDFPMVHTTPLWSGLRKVYDYYKQKGKK